MNDAANRAAAPSSGTRRVALGVVVVWLLAWLFWADRFGPTWDAANVEYSLGERLLAYVLRHPVAGSSDPRPGTYSEHLSAPASPFHPRAPHPDFPLPVAWHTTWPLTPILSAASCEIFWTRLGWLRPFPAHHLPVALASGLLAALVAVAAGRRLGPWTALAAAAFLLLSPRFCADAFNNLKDVPEACFYFAAMLAWRAAFARWGAGRWIGAGALTGLALAQKANALFLAPHMLAAFAALRLFGPRGAERARWSWTGTLLAALAFLAAYVALSPQYWEDPWTRIRDHFLHVLGSGNPFVVGGPPKALPPVSIDAFLLFVRTTPPALLLAAVLGLLNRRMVAADRVFFALGAAVPVARTLLPGMNNYDGVRHFLEFYPFLSVLGAAGVDFAARAAARLFRARGRAEVAVMAAVAAAFFVPTTYALAAVMPDGTVYYNALVGGVPGARARGDIGATDYWLNSYWRGLDWINAHADQGARIIVPIQPSVVRCAAPVKLRPDLALDPPDDRARGAAVFVMYATRVEWYPRALAALDQSRAPEHSIDVDGAPILKIHRFPPGKAGDDVVLGWRMCQRGEVARDYLIGWVATDQSRYLALRALLGRPMPVPEKAAAIRALVGLPPGSDIDFESFLTVAWR